MKLGISTYTYGWAFEAGANEYDLIAHAGSFGVSLVQVGDNLPLHLFSREQLFAFKSCLQQKNISIEVGARGLTEQRLLLYIGICKAIGAGLLRFVTDDGDYTPSAGDITKIIRKHLVFLQENDIVLAIENHDRLTAQELAGIIEAVDSPHAGICLDSVNSMGAGEHIGMVTNLLGPYTVNLHIKDFGIRRPEHKQGFMIEGRVAGEGRLDIPWLLQRIGSYHRCRTCILEQWVPPDKDRAATIEKERLWAQKSIDYLKKVLPALHS